MFSRPPPPLSLWRRKAQTVGYGAFSYKIDYIAQVQDIKKIKGYENNIICLKVKAVLLNWWILPIGRVALGRVCNQHGYPVYIYLSFALRHDIKTLSLKCHGFTVWPPLRLFWQLIVMKVFFISLQIIALLRHCTFKLWIFYLCIGNALAPLCDLCSS